MSIKTLHICPTNQDLYNKKEENGLDDLKTVSVRELSLNPDEGDVTSSKTEGDCLGGFRIPYFNSDFDMYLLQVEMLPTDMEREKIIKDSIKEHNLVGKIKDSNTREKEYEDKIVKALVASSGLSENGYKKIESRLNENFNTGENNPLGCEDLARYYEGKNQVFENKITFSKYGLSKAELKNAINRAVSHELYKRQYLPLGDFIDLFTSCMRSTVGDYYCSFVVYDILGLRVGEKPVRSIAWSGRKKKTPSTNDLVVHKTYERSVKQRKLRYKELQELIIELNAWIGGRGENSHRLKYYEKFNKCIEDLECGFQKKRIFLYETYCEEKHVSDELDYYKCLFEGIGTRFDELDNTRIALYTGYEYNVHAQRNEWKNLTPDSIETIKKEFKDVLTKICDGYDYIVDIKIINEYERFFDVYPMNKLDSDTVE